MNHIKDCVCVTQMSAIQIFCTVKFCRGVVQNAATRLHNCKQLPNVQAYKPSLIRAVASNAKRHNFFAIWHENHLTPSWSSGEKSVEWSAPDDFPLHSWSSGFSVTFLFLVSCIIIRCSTWHSRFVFESFLKFTLLYSILLSTIHRKLSPTQPSSVCISVGVQYLLQHIEKVRKSSCIFRYFRWLGFQ